MIWDKWSERTTSLWSESENVEMKMMKMIVRKCGKFISHYTVVEYKHLQIEWRCVWSGGPDNFQNFSFWPEITVYLQLTYFFVISLVFICFVLAAFLLFVLSLVSVMLILTFAWQKCRYFQTLSIKKCFVFDRNRMIKMSIVTQGFRLALCFQMPTCQSNGLH